MTTEEFMALVTRYTELCDDLGADLFNQTAEETAQKHATATAAWEQIKAEHARLSAEVARGERRAIMFGDVVHHQVLAMRAAVVAAHTGTPADGMRWISNTLEGPGHLPTVEDAKDGAQALFDREMAEHEAFRKAHPGPAIEGQGR